MLSCVPHGVLQARTLEWIAIPFSRDLPHPGIKPEPFVLQADFFTIWPPGKPNQSNLKETNPGYSFIGRTDAEAEAPILWPPDAKS